MYVNLYYLSEKHAVDVFLDTATFTINRHLVLLWIQISTFQVVIMGFHAHFKLNNQKY